MATSKKSLHDALRSKYMKMVEELFSSTDEELLLTGSNELTIPCLDSEGNEEFLVITFKVPTGSRDGDAYDGYAMAEEYRLKLAEKEAKAKESAEKKAQKIAKDKAIREEKAKAKLEKERGEA